MRDKTRIMGLPTVRSVVGTATRGVAGGIGLVSESIQAHNEKKQHEKQKSQDKRPASQTTDSKVDDHQDAERIEVDPTEEQWELDDAQDELSATAQSHQAGAIAPTQSDDAPLQEPTGRLGLPVVLPQRRPKERARGFIRAYAPELRNVGIDQATWLSFLDTFEKSTQASPWIQTINLAGIATGALPSSFAWAVSLAIEKSVGVAENLQANQRTNKFLHKANAELFRPRGVFCLVMTWRPDDNEVHPTVDINSTVSAALTSYESGVRNKFQSSNGKTYGEFAFPAAAPLVFPALDASIDSDDVAEGNHKEGLKQKLQRGKAFIDDYYDRRAQAEYANENPDNLLANQTDKPKFNSRFADPNHAANSGSIVSLATGGYVDPHANGRRRLVGEGPVARRLKSLRNDDSRLLRRREDRDFSPQGVAAAPVSSLIAAPKLVRKVLKKDVLYLMVVNMPSGQDLAAARAAMNQAGGPR
ncbi:hypothetical protein F4779DRAFT_609116 [Xylariaceae sp. FL0662B]|nr:hypothetical protein F4779DRAFT_609116 [Xylariaceae sp. FL0662B]